MTKEENEKRLEYLKGIVSRLPDKPGSYQFYDANKTIIYVGKAKSLKSRVSSYFHTEVDRFKTKVLVSKIFDISYTVVNTEEDALLLENSLIKKYNPRYNVHVATLYLVYLGTKFEGDWLSVAYNAGEGVAAQWQQEGVSIEDIPYAETREYVRKVRKLTKRYVRRGYSS